MRRASRRPVAPQSPDAQRLSAQSTGDAETASTVASTTGAPSHSAVVTTPLTDAPLTRRRARELAKSGVFTSGGQQSDAASTATADQPAEATVTAEPTIAGTAESHTAEPLMDDFVLLEPVMTDTVDGDAEAAEPDASRVAADEFEAAARLFSFTGETAIQEPAATMEPSAAFETAGSDPVEPTDRVQKGRGGRVAAKASAASFKRMAAASFSVAVMAVVGVLAVGLTTPAEAVAAGTSITPPAPAGDVLDPDSDEIQAYVAPAQVQNVALARAENYSAGTLVDLAGTEGISNFSSSVFTNDPNCSIQWPFAVGVTMTWGFGMRSGRMHEGIDFTPGTGAHIQAIGDGVVRISTDSGGAFGATVVIDHVVDGKLVSSRYAHLQYGSRQVQVGDTVSVGEYIGRTGNTGRSFGAHTHLEILANGTTPIDPLPWLRSHATC